MAGIQTVDSSGKMALALMKIDNLIEGGQVSLAKYNTQVLQNELSKMRLTDLNRKINQQTSQLSKAIADREKAENTVRSLTMDYHKKLETEKRKNFEDLTAAQFENFKNLTNEKLSNIQSTADLKATHASEIDAAQRAKDKAVWESENSESMRFDKSRDARIQELTSKGTLTTQEQTELDYLRMLDAGGDAEKFFSTIRQQGIDTSLTQAIEDLKKKQNKTPSELTQLRMMEMASYGQLQNVDASVIAKQFGWDASTYEIKQAEERVKRLLAESRAALTPQQTQAQQAEPSLEQMRQTAAQEAGIPVPAKPVTTQDYQNIMSQSPALNQSPVGGRPQQTPVAQVTDEQIRRSAMYAQQAGRTNAIIEQMRIGRGDPELRTQMHDEAMKDKELASTERTEMFKALPDNMKVAERLLQAATSPNATDADKQMAIDAMTSVVDAALLAHEGPAITEHIKRQIQRDPTSAEFWRAALMKAGQGLAESVAGNTKATGTRTSGKSETESLDTTVPGMKQFRETQAKGGFETIYDEIAAHPVIKTMGLPKGFTIKDGKWFWRDQKVGVEFKAGDPKKIMGSFNFSIDFLDKFVGGLRTRGYTPSQVLGILNDFEGFANQLGATGKPIKKEAIGNGPAQLAWTYGNISSVHGNLVAALRESLEKAVASEDLRAQESQEAGESKSEARKRLWAGFGDWKNSAVQSLTQTQETPTSTPTTSAAPSQTERIQRAQQGTSFKTFNPKTKQFEETQVEKLVKDGRGRVTGYYSQGKIRQFPKNAIIAGEHIPVPGSINVINRIPRGTPVVVNGKRYLFNRVYAPRAVEVLDENGDILKFSAAKGSGPFMFFPSDTPLNKLNELIQGFPHTISGNRQMVDKLIRGATNSISGRRQMVDKLIRGATNSISGRRQMLQRRSKINPMTPNSMKSTQPNSQAQKKNKHEVSGSPASAMTWETLKDGRRVARLDKEGRALATVLDLVPAGAINTGQPGIRDGDTISSVQVELPDWNRDNMPDDIVELEGGTRVALPDAWKKQEFTSGDGAVYTKDTDIRLAGFFAEEMTLENSNTLNPLGVRAQKELIRMFRQGWTDAKEQNRFIFKVRVVGIPTAHSSLALRDKKFANPYADRYNRIVTDVYVTVGSTQRKIAELTWVNAAKRMAQKGQGQIRSPW